MAVGAILEDVQHGLQVPGNVLKTLCVNGFTIVTWVKAVVDVVVDQRPLGIGHGFFNSVQLLRDFTAGAALGNHGDDCGKMAVGPFQSR